MRGDERRPAAAPGERCASTSNRNFEGRQGAGARTHLMSPAMAAAAAIAGHIVDVRERRRMIPLRQVEGRAISLPDADIDTDIIFPARFLLITEKRGLGRYAFHDRRGATARLPVRARPAAARARRS